MKLGYANRQLVTNLLQVVRDVLDFTFYVIWLLFDFSKFKKIKTENIKNILIIYGGAVGDTYNSLGLINRLNKNYPKLNIYYLTKKKNEKFICSDKINIINLAKARNLINKNKIDALVLLHGASLNREIFSKEMYFEILKIPYRVSCDSVQIHPKLFVKQLIPLFVTRKIYTIKKNSFRNHADAFETLGFNVDSPLFHYTKESEVYSNEFIKKHKISKAEKLIFFHPGSGKIMETLSENKTPSKLWPSERWAKVADILIEKYNARILIEGINEEVKLVEDIFSQIKNKKKVIKMTEFLTMEQMASLFKKGDLLITINTSISHIGVQAGIPLIDLFGPIWPEACSTLGKSIDLFHNEVCNSCRKYACPEGNNICMKAISVNEVLNAADSFLENE